MKVIVQKSKQNVNSHAGLLLTKTVLDKVHSLGAFNLFQHSKLSFACQKFSNDTVIKVMIALISLGKPAFANLAAYQRDTLFADVAGGKIPSEATFRQRMEMLACCTYFMNVVDDANLEVLRQAKTFGDVEAASGIYTPIDCDVSVLVNDDSKKEGIGFTYHRIFGYAPIFCTIGTNGWQLANELRPGNQHSQKEFLPFLNRCVYMAEKLTDKKLLLRIDSAHDADETLAECYRIDDTLSKRHDAGASGADGLSFIVKCNPRGEDGRTYVEQAKGNNDKPYKSYRDEKKKCEVKIWRGIVSHKRTPSTQERPLFCVYEVVETKADDELFPNYEHALWWTNLPDDSDTVIELYHAHATHEQFHSELKTDLDVERLPSGKFNVNSLVLALASIAFNTLRLIGDTYLEVSGDASPRKRLRLRTVLLNIIYVGAIIGTHAGVQILRLGRNCAIADHFIGVYERLSA